MSLLLMLLLLSLLVIAHELGHLFVARWCGVRVERFGLGLPIGPTLWSRTIGPPNEPLELCLHILPLGGYVAFPDDDVNSRVPPGSKKRFENQPPLNKAAIALAGITVNALLAWLLIWLVFFGWGAPGFEVFIGDTLLQKQAIESTYRPTPNTLIQQGDFLALAKLSAKPSPRFRLQGNEVASVLEPMAMLWRRQMPRVLAGNTRQHPFTLVVEPQAVPGQTVAQAYQSGIAERGGLKSGDQLLRVGDYTVTPYPSDSVQRVIATIKQAKGAPIVLDIREAGTQLEKRLTLIPDTEGRVGIQLAPKPVQVPTNGLVDAGVKATEFLGSIVQQNTEGLIRMARGEVNKDELAGPIRIVDAGARVIEEEGIHKGLLLAGIISMILAVMNLLPIPPLDGSYLIYIAVEAITGRQLNKKVQQALGMAGFAAFLLLSAFVFWNDIELLMTRGG